MCPVCSAEQTTFPVWVPHRQITVYFWRECRCQVQAFAASIERVNRRAAARRQAEADALLGESGMARIEQFTLNSFNLNLLRGDPMAHPYHRAVRWLTVVTQQHVADYHDSAAEPACLYFYSPQRGTGKTHLAAALARECRVHHSLVAFVEEATYLERLWSCPRELVPQILRLPGERAWLTVLDDLGQRTPARGSDSIANAWYQVVNARWLGRGWTIITSNWTLEELLERGTINQATYSRLFQMTRGEYTYFDGEDQRLVGI